MTDSQPPRAIHLAAGEGSRLRPITNDRPKPLVELGEASLLEHNVQTLEDAGVTDQLAITGYRADQIEALDDDLETVHNPVYDETDMVYSLFRAEERFPQGRDLVISYGDIVYEQRVVEALLDSDAPMAVVVDRDWRRLWEHRFEDPLEDAETLRIDAEGRIREIGGDPEAFDEIEGQYIGLVKLRADYSQSFAERYHELAETDTDEYASVEMTHFIQSLVDDDWDVRAVPIEGGWLEVDTVEDLEGYRTLYENDNLGQFVEL